MAIEVCLAQYFVSFGSSVSWAADEGKMFGTCPARQWCSGLRGLFSWACICVIAFNSPWLDFLQCLFLIDFSHHLNIFGFYNVLWQHMHQPKEGASTWCSGALVLAQSVSAGSVFISFMTLLIFKYFWWTPLCLPWIICISGLDFLFSLFETEALHAHARPSCLSWIFPLFWRGASRNALSVQKESS